MKQLYFKSALLVHHCSGRARISDKGSFSYRPRLEWYFISLLPTLWEYTDSTQQRRVTPTKLEAEGLNLKIHHEVISHLLEIVAQFSDYRTSYCKRIILWAAVCTLPGPAELQHKTFAVLKTTWRMTMLPKWLEKGCLPIWIPQRTLKTTWKYHRLQ